MKLKYNLFALIMGFGLFLTAQDHNHIEEDHNHHDDHEHHVHHKNEIGVANTLVYFVKEKEFAYGLHVHYIRNIKDTKFGIGLGYERIFDEHKHNTIGLIGFYRPIEKLGINISPGIAFEDGESSNIHFAIHIETSYEFEINDFHVGPTIGLASDSEDYHISFGIHLGYGF